jgi:hypothetical protein
MIHVKYILPHHRIGRVESMEKEAKKTQKMLQLSRPRIDARLRKPKRRLSRRINLLRSHGWCRSGAPEIATPTKNVDPKRREEV